MYATPTQCQARTKNNNFHNNDWQSLYPIYINWSENEKKMVTFQNFGKNEIKEKKFFAHFNCQDEMPIINSIYTL